MMHKHKKDHDQKPWLTLCILSLLFYGVMLMLTLFAKDIHNARLPQVTAERPGKQPFSYTAIFEGYTSERTGSYTALPKTMVDSGKVFTLKSVMKEDFIYYYAEQVSVVVDTSKENADYYAISEGLSSRDIVIMSGYETLRDGDEVCLIQENKKEKEELSTDNLFQ